MSLFGWFIIAALALFIVGGAIINRIARPFARPRRDWIPDDPPPDGFDPSRPTRPDLFDPKDDARLK